MGMRFKLPPGGDCPPIVAARRLWLTLEQFTEQLPALQQRGFPAADKTTGMYDLDAIDAWRRTRNPQVYGERLTLAPTARNAQEVAAERLARIRSG